MKKVLVTGSNGLLGQSLLQVLLSKPEQYTVIGVARGNNRSGRTDFEYRDLDLLATETLIDTLEEVAPDVIVNTAAMTHVDQCEDAKAQCDALNITLVEVLANYAAKTKCHLIHLSTDFVFDGQRGYYKEEDAVNPLSYYGKSKVRSEEVLQESNCLYTVLRTILVYGKVFDMSRSNIVLWVKGALERGEEINVVTDQYRMPTYVVELAKACELAIAKASYGTFHISSNTLMSIYEIAQEIATTFELDGNLIKPIPSSVLNQRALRPLKTGFNLDKTEKELGLATRSFKEDLQKFKHSIT
ncbi:NAD(P)-dependent oxidoreductase [Tenacibaculum litopenaei]|uniref:SDR family oxidoreductase n=1 Tax=Tenacibaculum litopenaei TaxID=396016 RepID=UPI0038939091